MMSNRDDRGLRSRADGIGGDLGIEQQGGRGATDRAWMKIDLHGRDGRLFSGDRRSEDHIPDWRALRLGLGEQSIGQRLGHDQLKIRFSEHRERFVQTITNLTPSGRNRQNRIWRNKNWEVRVRQYAVGSTQHRPYDYFSFFTRRWHDPHRACSVLTGESLHDDCRSTGRDSEQRGIDNLIRQ